MAQCKFTCPHCHFEHIVGETARGKILACAGPSCRKLLQVERHGQGCRALPEAAPPKLVCAGCGEEHVVADPGHMPSRCFRCNELLTADMLRVATGAPSRSPYAWVNDLDELGGGILPTFAEEDLVQLVAKFHGILEALKGHPKHRRVFLRVLRMFFDEMCAESLLADEGEKSPAPEVAQPPA
ncbi:MAG TPA: hypothetical protein VK395_29790 [Gemmataceae bacterium]|nr:hypothetical protein [Gemmataceae bacterium]